MPYSIPQDSPNVVVGQPVVHDTSLLPPFDHPIHAKQSQLMAHRRLARAQEQRKVAHTELLCQAERLQDSRPGWIRKQCESFRHEDSSRRVQHTSEQRPHIVWMKAFDIATLGRQNI